MRHLIILSIIFIFLSISCKKEITCVSPYNLETASFLMDNTAPNPLNGNNIIFKSKRTFTYEYDAKDKDGNALDYYFKFDKECFIDRTIDCASSDIILSDSISFIEKNSCLHKIDYIELSVFESMGHTSLSNSQTIIKYEYFNRKNGRIFNGEVTGVVEDSISVFLHPPRLHGFKITEFNPFLRVELPLKIGGFWQGMIDIPADFVAEVMPHYKGDSSISLNTEYEVTDKQTFKNPNGDDPVECYKISATNEGVIGKTYADFYFNEDKGFLAIDYINYDSSSLSLKLVNISDDINSK